MFISSWFNNYVKGEIKYKKMFEATEHLHNRMSKENCRTRL